MNFCVNCEKYLKIKEEKDNNGKRDIYYYCEKDGCNFKQKCTKYQIDCKVYQQKYKDRFMNFNEYKTNDITLSAVHSKCPKCNRTNLNRFERKYHKNKFFVNNICSTCFHSWS